MHTDITEEKIQQSKRRERFKTKKCNTIFNFCPTKKERKTQTKKEITKVGMNEKSCRGELE